MIIRFGKKFTKQFEKTPFQIKNSFNKRIKLFDQNSLHPLLNNHPLAGKLLGFRSINITGDWRAIYSERQDSDGEMIVFFELIGTHSQLYG
jgi:addiction module RelE/StbE family toxin